MQMDPALLEINEKIKILLVEDSKLSREYIRRILCQLYKHIMIAEDGLEGIQKFQSYQPDLVITDIRMPKMDGLSMIQEMKKIRSDFYSIVLSAHDEKELLKQSIQRGVNRFITKPIDIEELLKTIEDIRKTIIYVKKLNKQNQLIENILNSLEIIVAITDGNQLYALNQYGLDMVGYSSIMDFKKDHKCICEFFINDPGYIPNRSDWIEYLSSLKEEERKVKIQHVKTQKQYIFYVKSKQFLDDASKKIVSFYDITLQEKQKEELRKIATKDFLTGIYNRNHFHTVLQFHIEKHRRYVDLNPFAILLIDLDYFKKINDEYGHLMGDQVLKEFAEIIKNNIRRSDFFARWGGEEFIILAPEITKEKSILLAEKIRTLVEEHFKNHQDLPAITVSIGVTLYHREDSTKRLLERVDKALYQAKRMGRNRIEFL